MGISELIPIIASASSIIVAFIIIFIFNQIRKNKKTKITVKFNDKEIEVKGYSENEIIEILKNLNHNDKKSKAE